MKEYIDFKIEKITNAVNSFEKYIFKFMINSVYSKNNRKFAKKNQCQTSKQ